MGFCVLVPGARAGPELAMELANQVTLDVGKSFAPERIVFVEALPKTRSAKIVRRSMRALVLGQDPGDLSALEDASVLAAIETTLAGQS